MTWSIIARDGSGALGIAIASRFFAVGALTLHIRSGIGAVSTQALCNPMYGARVLDSLAAGATPRDAVEAAVEPDDGREHRQLHAVAADGATYARTGASCIEWCGHFTGEGFSVAGNMLAGPQVIEATAQAWRANGHLEFAERLVEALAAGETAGGDKRGKQAAALRIHTTEDYPALDIRVDDHEEPIAQLRRLCAKSLERFVPFSQFLPTRANPAGTTDRAVIEAGIEAFHAQRRR
ncbi:DUF1028 domain-containing protein [Ramlibacter albus]|uniref:DUF1028 domain-containing protein n=1 Tax=Ramlibacter albus TaxID=2079448 RepID=A0A923MBS3_9BURK|nr:DUF1028 domain-containing protein [Ramlibacter albus]MBC5766483.1 DUF1028 domain-containing protein [Ramlibacter albus]